MQVANTWLCNAGPRVDVTLGGATFLPSKNAFSGIVRGNMVQFDLGGGDFYAYFYYHRLDEGRGASFAASPTLTPPANASYSFTGLRNG